MSFISPGNRIVEYYNWNSVRDIRVLFNRLVNARNDEGQRLPWNMVLFALIHRNNWNHSKKEYAGGLFYTVLNHNRYCMCGSAECRATRPRARPRRPNAGMIRITEGYATAFNNDPANEQYEIVAGQREIKNPKTGKYETIFVWGILDNQRDLEQQLDRLANPYIGYQNKFDRLLWMRENMGEIQRNIRQRERIIDAYLNGRQ